MNTIEFIIRVLIWWGAIGFVVSVLIGQCIHKLNGEHDDDEGRDASQTDAEPQRHA